MTQRKISANISKDYYFLAKPGIIYGNAIPAAAGFLLASKGHLNIGLFVATLFGLSFVIASACVLNNYIDRSIDENMVRTKNRALVKKIIPVGNAIIFATFLGIIGFLLLILLSNLLTAFIAFIGFFFYVVMYSIWKRRSVHGTIVGSVAGAVPPVIGYTAVTNHIDAAAILLFLILVLWQMPHFYAIALYRLHDYVAANIPILPVKKGIHFTKITMIFYIIAFIVATCLLTVLHFTGYIYLVVALLLGLVWLGLSIKGLTVIDTAKWAKKMFFFSLIILLVLSLMIALRLW